MKKAIALLLTVSLVIIMLPLGIYAEGEPTITLSTSADENLTVGDTFTVTATLANNPGYASLTLSLNWNTDVVKFAGFSTTFDEEDEIYVLTDSIIGRSAVYNQETGIVTVARTSNSTKNGTLFIANFTVVGDGDCEIALEKGDPAKYTFANVDRQDITVGFDETAVENLSVSTPAEPDPEPEEPSEPEGYAATITASAENPSPVRIGQTLKIIVGANKNFASTEMTITYPADLVSFDKDNSILGSATVNPATAGTLELADYGSDKTTAESYVLAFKANAQGAASFAITYAGFGTAGTAEKEDLIEATKPEALTITIAEQQFTVTFSPEGIFEGASSANEGDTYTFKPETATGAYYDYKNVTATMNGQPVTVVSTETGWKIENVSGNLVISGERTAKNYTVTWDGTGKNDVTTKPTTATYGTDFTVTLPADQDATESEPGWAYSISATKNGVSIGSYDATTRTLTISGANITDNIVITVTKSDLLPTQVTVSVTGEGLTINGQAVSSLNVDRGSNVVLALSPEAGYTYVVKVNNAEVTLTNNQYTIVEVDGDVVVTVTKTLNTACVVESFMTLDGVTMNLVTIKSELIEGKTYTYKDQNMYWSEKYGAYAILVIGDVSPVAADFALITVEEVPTVAYDGDVNGTGNMDANDAQLVYNMYNIVYKTGFTENVTMEKFLEADVNGDKKIDSTDAAFIINQILGISNN